MTGGSTSSRYTYTSRESDLDTGLMYYRARWYDPLQSRFISEDPSGFKGGVDYYVYVVYVKNNPARYRDPFGKDIYPMEAAP